jgi:hypothetical protein
MHPREEFLKYAAARAPQTDRRPSAFAGCLDTENRRAAVESIIEADPIATYLRAIMVGRTKWPGSVSDLLRLCTESARDDMSRGRAWAKNPRALAGRLRRAQPFLQTLGIEITFSREGRTGSSVIRMHTTLENTVSTLSTVRDVGLQFVSGQRGPPDDNGRSFLAEPCPTEHVTVTAARC